MKSLIKYSLLLVSFESYSQVALYGEDKVTLNHLKSYITREYEIPKQLVRVKVGSCPERSTESILALCLKQKKLLVIEHNKKLIEKTLSVFWK